MKKEKEMIKYQSVPSEPMIVHLQVIGGGPDEIQKVSKYMKAFANNNDINIKFIVSNENINIQSVDWMLAELHKLKGELK
jgi:hypothetical protein